MNATTREMKCAYMKINLNLSRLRSNSFEGAKGCASRALLIFPSPNWTQQFLRVL